MSSLEEAGGRPRKFLHLSPTGSSGVSHTAPGWSRLWFGSQGGSCLRPGPGPFRLRSCQPWATTFLPQLAVTEIDRKEDIRGSSLPGRWEEPGGQGGPFNTLIHPGDKEGSWEGTQEGLLSFVSGQFFWASAPSVRCGDCAAPLAKPWEHAHYTPTGS